MSIDASAVARAVGISTEFKDLRGGSAQFLPQHIALFAQGETGVSYSTTKFQVTSPADVGSAMGYRSPAYLALRELQPAIGTIPVTVFPLAEAVGATASTGDVTPSGTMTKAASYKLRIGGVESNSFVIPKGAVSVNAALAAMGQAVSAVPHMPVNVSYTYGTLTSVAGGSNTGNGTLATLSATGTPIPGDWVLTCTAAATDAGTFRLVNPDGSVISSAVSVTGVPQEVGGITFTLSDGAVDFVVGDTFTITVPATKLDLTSAWKGATANRMIVEVIGDTTLGGSFAITQLTGGLVDPTVDSALAQVGSTWYSMGLNTLDPDNTTAMDAFEAHGESLWGALVHKHWVVFRGNCEPDRGLATAITSARQTDRVNSQLVCPGSPNLPFVVAAAQLAKIVAMANNNPAHDYGSQACKSLIAGAESVQWDYTARDVAVKAGSSTVQIKDGVVNISDVVTHYAPSGEAIPGYRFVVDIVKLQQLSHNMNLTFGTAEWDGAPLIADVDVTVNPTAKKPKMGKLAANNVLQGLGDEAVLSNVKASKKLTTSAIDGSNPKRLNVGVKVYLAGNTNIVDVVQNYGFLLG